MKQLLFIFFLFLHFQPFYCGIKNKFSIQTYVPTKDEKKSLTALMLYAGAHENPEIFKKKEHSEQKINEIKNILDKKGGSLTIIEQFKLLKDTMYLTIFDNLLSESLVSYGTSWVLIEIIDALYKKMNPQKEQLITVVIEHATTQEESIVKVNETSIWPTHRDQKRTIIQTLAHGVRLIPLLKALINFIRVHRKEDMQLSKEEAFFDGLKKNISRKYSDSIDQRKERIIESIIKPLWKKHQANEHEIFKAIVTMGDSIRNYALCEQHPADSTAAAHKQLVFLYSSVITSKPHSVINGIMKTFKRNMLKRFLLASMYTTLFVSFLIGIRATTKPHFLQNYNHPNHLEKIFGFIFLYLNVKALLDRAAAYSPTKAASSYLKLTKELAIPPHLQRAFYNSWYLPIWKSYKGDAQKIKQHFDEHAERLTAQHDILFASQKNLVVDSAATMPTEDYPSSRETQAAGAHE